jgi:transposase InsO family protein
MKFRFIEMYQEQFPVARMCGLLEVSTSGYYAWRARPLSGRARANREMIVEIQDIHAQSRQTYGSPRVHAELLARGFSASKNRVARLMRAENIQSRRKKKRQVTTNSRHAYPIAPNLLQRDFQAAAPNEKWLADITLIPTGEGWLYLAAILDLFSRKVIGWAMDESLESVLVEQAFHMAVQNRKQVDGLLHHTDRGSRYAGRAYRKLLAAVWVSLFAAFNYRC